MIKKVSISTHNGTAYRREHNARNPKITSKEKHIDPNGTYEIWVDEKPRDAYNRIFGDSLKEYNDKQKRDDRKIKSYYDHICKDAKKHPVYEMIIGVYDKSKDKSAITEEEQKTILKEFVRTWGERNPQLELIGAYYHADEMGAPHVHLDYIPIAKGYSRGLSIQNGLDKALQQMGYETKGKQTAQIKWEYAQNQYLGSLCVERGLLVHHETHERREHLNTEDYKKTKRVEELTEQQQTLTDDINIKAIELQNLQESIEQAKVEYKSIRAKNSLMQAVRDAYGEPEHSVEILESKDAKTNFKGQITRPDTVTISREDYYYIQERAKASQFVMNALDKLQRLGNRLTKEVDESQRIQELQDLVKDLKIQLNAATRKSQEAIQYAKEIKYWMISKQDQDGYNVWDYFIAERMKEQQLTALEQEQQYNDQSQDFEFH